MLNLPPISALNAADLPKTRTPLPSVSPKASPIITPLVMLRLPAVNGTVRILQMRQDGPAIIDEELGYVTRPTVNQLKSLLTTVFPEGAPQGLISLLGLFPNLPPWPSDESTAPSPSSHD